MSHTCTPADVTVVVCCYTEERLDDVLAAVGEAQRQGAGQVVVVVDHNPGLLATLSVRLTGVDLLPNAGPQGLSGGRNTAVAAATGDVVAFLDDDACPEPGWLDALLAEYDDPEVLGVGGRAEPAWPKDRPAWFPPEFLWVVGCSYVGQPTERAEVRNFIGANMSFRREVFARVGGFEHDLGRIGTRPLGCEESEFCIRVHQQVPGSRLVLTPAAVVRHRVTAVRTTWRYYADRCWSEGLSKALVTLLVGQQDGLSSERAYVRSVLPRAAARGLREALAGDRAGAQRSAAVVGGLALTSLGYARGRVALTRSGRVPGPRRP